MSTYTDASLIYYPSGYKASKAYSLKPTDGSGDLTFTRASTATRVNEQGLIEGVRTNLILQSNTFNTTWTTTSTTLTSGQSGYDGTTNAWLLTKPATSFARIQQTFSSTSGLKTFSVYLKAGTLSWCRLFAASAPSPNIYVNLSNGSLGSQYDNISATSIDVGAGWYRVSLTFDASITEIRIYPADANDSVSGISGSIYIQDAQLEASVQATEYIPTTTTAVSVGMLANVPRIDYTGGGCGKLLLEPQRTNLLIYSSEFDNAAWTKLNGTVSANQAEAPDGTISADLFYPTTSGADRLLAQSKTGTIGQTFTSSAFVKSSGVDWVLFYAANIGACWFNASTGVFGTVGSGVTASVLGQVNGFWRISLTATIANTNVYFYIGTANANGISTITKNGTDGIYLWGCQLEEGSYATSYIPTTSGTAVTRLADAVSKTGISSLIGQTEGVIFLDFIASAQNADGVAFSAITIFGNATDNFQIYTVGAALYWYARVTAGLIFDQTASETLVAGQRYKMAYAYKSGDWALYINGVQKRTNTAAAVPAVSQFNLNATSYGASVATVKNDFSQALLFPTRLTNTQLATLTTI